MRAIPTVDQDWTFLSHCYAFTLLVFINGRNIMANRNKKADELSVDIRRREFVRGLLRRLPSPDDWGEDLPEALRLMLTMSIKTELNIREWLQPRYRDFPWAAISCSLVFENTTRLPDHPPRLALTTMVETAGGYQEPMIVPYTTEKRDKSGMVIGAIFAGDRVILKSFPGIRFVVHELRPEKNLILVSSEGTPINDVEHNGDRWKLVGPIKHDDTPPGSKPSHLRASSENMTRSSRNSVVLAPRIYKELHPIHFLGCIVYREARIGPLNNVYNDWSTENDFRPEEQEKLKFATLHQILFAMPAADFAAVTKSLKELAKRRLSLLNLSHATDSSVSTEPGGRNILQRASLDRLRSQSASAQRRSKDDDESSRASGQGKPDADPVTLMQRQKHVEQWAVRKAELAAATSYLSKIDHFPATDALIGSENASEITPDNKIQHKRHRLSAEKNARKSLWLGIGRALRALSRGNSDAQGMLLNAWRVWSQFHDRELAAQSRSNELAPLVRLDMLEDKCVAAWYAQRLRTNCDARELVRARTLIRKRLHQLREQGIEANLGQIFGRDGSLRPQNWSDEICRSIVEIAVVGGFLDVKRTELRFLDCKKARGGENGYYTSENNDSFDGDGATELIVPCAKHVIRKVYDCEYPWLLPKETDVGFRRKSAKVEDEETYGEVEEISETTARIAPGDVLYLAMGRDDISNHSARVKANELHNKTTPIAIPNDMPEGVMKAVPFKWCEVLAVDVLFARLLLRPLARPAPECWVHDADENRDHRVESRGSTKQSSGKRGSGSSEKSDDKGLWVPVALLWDAVVFSPQRCSTEQYIGPDGWGDAIQISTRNGMQFMECRYSVFTVPTLSAASALAYLKGLAEALPLRNHSRLSSSR